MESMLEEIARHARTAAFGPKRGTRLSSSSHHPLANPPLRPLGPPPQMSCSRITIPRPGSAWVRKYAVHKPVKPPPMMTTSALISFVSGGQFDPGSAARVSLSYLRIREHVDDAAHALAAHGVGRSDRVAMVFPNGPEAILLFVAASMVATACPLNAAYKEDEFRFYLDDVGARFLLVPPGEAEAARRAIPTGLKVIQAAIDDSGRLRVNGDGHGKPPDSVVLSSAVDIGLVLHTSRTTSLPNRVPLRN